MNCLTNEMKNKLNCLLKKSEEKKTKCTGRVNQRGGRHEAKPMLLSK